MAVQQIVQEGGAAARGAKDEEDWLTLARKAWPNLIPCHLCPAVRHVGTSHKFQSILQARVVNITTLMWIWNHGLRNDEVTVPNIKWGVLLRVCLVVQVGHQPDLADEVLGGFGNRRSEIVVDH